MCFLPLSSPADILTAMTPASNRLMSTDCLFTFTPRTQSLSLSSLAFFFSLFFNTTTCARDFVYLSLNISVALFLSQSLFLYRNNLTFVIRTFPSIGGRNRICARNNDNSNIIMLAIMITVISEKEATIILLVMVVLS